VRRQSPLGLKDGVPGGPAGPGGPQGEGSPERGTDAALADPGGGARIVCRACRHRVTSAGARREVNGAHRHVFFNPGGFVFDLACFAAAPGVSLTGNPSTEFTWFPGYAWRIALCGGCYEHLGWRYQGEGTFFGLIWDRLDEESEPGDRA